MNTFLINLSITLLVEITIALFFFKQEEGVSVQRVLLANLISNPIAQFLVRNLFFPVIITEIFVIFFEACFYTKHFKKYPRALIISFILNTSSTIIGLVIHSLIRI